MDYCRNTPFYSFNRSIRLPETNFCDSEDDRFLIYTNAVGPSVGLSGYGFVAQRVKCSGIDNLAANMSFERLGFINSKRTIIQSAATSISLLVHRISTHQKTLRTVY